MKITCKNFGPIESGTLDISKNLILITGANNSGKTYFSYLIYGLIKSQENFQVNQYFINADSIKTEPLEGFPGTIQTTISVDLIDLYKSKQLEILEAFGRYAFDCVNGLFPKGNNFKHSKFIFSDIDDEPFLRSLQFTNFTDNGDSTKEHEDPKQNKFFSFHKLEKQNKIFINIREEASNKHSAAVTDLDNAIIHNVILRQLLLHAFNTKTSNIKLFPAERIAIDVFGNDISNGRGEIAQELESARMQAYVKGDLFSQAFFGQVLKKASTNFYAIPLKDAIVSSLVAMMHSRNNGEFFWAGQEIEEKILNGDLSFGNKEVDYDILFTARNSSPVRIEMASS